MGCRLAAVGLVACSPHEAKRNAGAVASHGDTPDFASLHPGYECCTAAGTREHVKAWARGLPWARVVQPPAGGREAAVVRPARLVRMTPRGRTAASARPPAQT